MYNEPTSNNKKHFTQYSNAEHIADITIIDDPREVYVTKKKISQLHDSKRLLREMGNYFELPAKSVNFWIRQMELSGKL